MDRISPSDIPQVRTIDVRGERIPVYSYNGRDWSSDPAMLSEYNARIEAGCRGEYVGKFCRDMPALRV